MTVRVGQQIWIPCEIKPGAFSDESLVRVSAGENEWVGFVPSASLQFRGNRHFILASVVEVSDDEVSLQFSGHALTPTLFQDRISRLTERGSFQ